MKEESNLGIRKLLANHAGNQQQMVVVDPDDITTLPILDNLVCKCLVDVNVKLPRVIFVCLALGIVGYLVMKDWPQDLLAKVAIMAVKVLVGAEDGQHVVLGSERVFNVLFLLGAIESISRHTQRANPHAVAELSISGSCIDGVP